MSMKQTLGQSPIDTTKERIAGEAPARCNPLAQLSNASTLLDIYISGGSNRSPKR